ncbi:MAG: site-specific integrase [Pseudomonadota bacterium]
MDQTKSVSTTGRPNKGGRKLTGTKLYQGSDGFYRARVWRVIDGVRVRPVINFQTTSKLAAAAKLRAELAKDAPEFEALGEPETFAQAAKRIVELQGEEGMRTWHERWRRIEQYALPELGGLDVRKITTAQCREVLAEAGKTLSKQSVSHLRTDMSTVFQQLWSDDVIPGNPLEKGKLKLPKNLKVDGRPRLILSDDEFDQLLGYALESEGRRTLGLMCLASRAFGGQRTSDLHAWDWRHVDTKTWATAKVYRPKTERNEDGTPAHESELTAFEMPAVLLGPLKGYWASKGKPKTGPVFPIAIGENAGERHGKRSYVRELRAALWEAGVRRPMADTSEAREALNRGLAGVAKARQALAAVQGKPDGRQGQGPSRAGGRAAGRGRSEGALRLADGHAPVPARGLPQLPAGLRHGRLRLGRFGPGCHGAGRSLGPTHEREVPHAQSARDRGSAGRHAPAAFGSKRLDSVFSWLPSGVRCCGSGSFYW